MKILDRVDKKIRYAVVATIYAIYAYFASVYFWNGSLYLRIGLGAILIISGTFIIHYPNISFKMLRSLFVLTLPLSFLASILLAFKYYPALSLHFKLLLLFAATVVFYIISLVDNIFLIVHDRDESIPLYRAAIPWGQILVVAIAIPLFAGVYKIPVNSLIQAFTIALMSTLFALYQFWFLRKESNLIPVGVGGKVVMSMFVGFLVYIMATAVSFIRAESFMRSLAAGSTLMLGIMFAYAYLKNTINKRILLEYFLILIIFLLFSFIFNS